MLELRQYDDESLALPRQCPKNGYVAANLVLHIAPVLAHLHAFVGEKVRHATQQHLRVEVSMQLAIYDVVVQVLGRFL